MAVTLQFNLVL